MASSRPPGAGDRPCAVVTGAAGFIGGYVVEEFLEQGWRVCALVHRRESRRLTELAEERRLTLVRGDAADATLGERVLLPALDGRRPDAVVHCAGRASDVGRRSAFLHANLESVRGLVAFCAKAAVPCLTFVSTTDVYGLRDFHGEGEDDLPLDNNTGNPYPGCKIAAEEHIRACLPRDRWAIVRPAAVWGVGDRTLTPRVVGFLRHSPAIVHFGRWHGGNRWPLAHVRNVAAAVYIATACAEAHGQPVNVLDDEWTSVDEVYRILASVYLPSRRFRSVTVPVWAAWPLAWAVTGISGLAGLTRPLTDPSLYALRTVSSNLDFGTARLRGRLGQAGRGLVTREEGLEELRRTLSGARRMPGPV
jgi:nucleoside-diphosphate-sugar epimerase